MPTSDLKYFMLKLKNTACLLVYCNFSVKILDVDWSIFKLTDWFNFLEKKFGEQENSGCSYRFYGLILYRFFRSFGMFLGQR
jgi:hypothetical protein